MTKDGWIVRHWAIIATVIGVTSAAASAALSLRQHVDMQSEKLQRHESQITDIQKRAAEDHEQLRDVVGDVKYIRREIDRQTTILDRIDKKMP